MYEPLCNQHIKPKALQTTETKFNEKWYHAQVQINPYQSKCTNKTQSFTTEIIRYTHGRLMHHGGCRQRMEYNECWKNMKALIFGHHEIRVF